MRPLTITLTAVSFVFFSATCVTDARQKEPGGPWVGDVVNTGDAVVYGAHVRYRTVDEAGPRLSFRPIPTCPSRIEPGQRGAWEIFPGGVDPLPVQPSSMIARSSTVDPGTHITGLEIRLVERNEGRKYALIEITNRSEETYHWVMICGTLRSPTGAIEEVGRTPPLGNGFPFTSLLPGEKRMKLIYFHSMPEGVFEFFPSGRSVEAAGELRIPPENMRILRARTLTDVAGDPYLDVLAELTNPFDVPVQGLMASTYLEGSAELRDEDIEVGCGGAIGASETVPIKFAMPTKGVLEVNVPVIESIGAVTGAVPQIRVPVSELRVIDGKLVGRFVNPTDTGVAIYGICVGVRRGERLIDAFNAKIGPYLAANSSVEAAVIPDAIPAYDGASFEVIAFGTPLNR
jgi:hypothetical protein